MKKSKKVLALALAAVMAVSVFAGCGGGDGETTTAPTTTGSNGETTEAPTTTSGEPATKLSICLPYGDHAYDEDAQTIAFRKKIEEYTNTEITWELYDSASYYEKLTLKYASGDLTSIMVTDNNTEFQNACQYNVFWDVTDYLDLYDNLTVISETVRKGASFNGKLYGVPRNRSDYKGPGRNSTGYRQDWADALNIGHPETLEDFYDMLVAFTTDDPDKNGKDDTYGLALDAWPGAIYHMLCWFGAPDTWGLDANGDLVYYAMTEEYKTGLKWLQKIYSEGLIPADFFQTSAGGARTAYVQNGLCGVYVQCVDDVRRAATNMVGTEEKPGLFPNAVWTYLTAVDAGHGLRVKPANAGFSGFVAITKSLSPTEEDMMKALEFLNDINDAEIANMINFGFEGQDHFINENGYAQMYTTEERTAAGLGSVNYLQGYNQMVPYFHNETEAAKLIGKEEASDIEQRQYTQAKENEKYLVTNYGYGLTSATLTEKGADLTGILETTMWDYIQGLADDTQLQASIDQWYEAGGKQVTAEMNEMYDALYN